MTTWPPDRLAEEEGNVDTLDRLILLVTSGAETSVPVPVADAGRDVRLYLGSRRMPFLLGLVASDNSGLRVRITV
jgi:hypothetical protein